MICPSKVTGLFSRLLSQLARSSVYSILAILLSLIVYPFLDTIILIVYEKSRNARSRIYPLVLKVIQKHPRSISSLRTDHLFYSSIPTFPLNLSSFLRCNIVKIIDPLEIILLGRQAILNVLVPATRKAMMVQQVSPS